MKKQVYLLIPLVIIFSFGIDAYVPFLVDISKDLAVTPDQVQLTMSAYLLAIAVGQLAVAVLADKFGRKSVLYVCCALFILSTIGCMLSSDIIGLIAFRFLQGLSASGLRVCSYILISDDTRGDETASTLSFLYSTISISPVIAPILSGMIGNYFGDWRYAFLILILLSIIAFSCIPYLKENYIKENYQFSFRQIFKVISEKRLLYYGILSGIGMSIMFSYVCLIPYIVQVNYHLPFSYIYVSYIIAGVGVITVGKLSKFIIYYFGRQKTLKYSFILASILLVVLFVFGLMGLLNYTTITIISTVLLSVNILINGCATALALNNRIEGNALVVSVMGILSYLIAAIISWLIVQINPNIISYSGVILVLCLLLGIGQAVYIKK